MARVETVEKVAQVRPTDDSIMIQVDEQDKDLLALAWHIVEDGKTSYARRSVKTPKRAELSLHRVIYERIIGRDLLPSEYVDHKDRNGLNNTRTNLRLSTSSQNQANSGAPVTNTSGHKGVHFNTARGKWHAQIKKDGEVYYLGLYTDINDAIAAYKAKAKELYGEFFNG